jgi:acyl transferase domain-containing protein
MNNLSPSKLTDGIAIIGLSGRFPGANNIDEFWQNVKNGVESIAFLSDQELLAEGIDSATLADPSYIKAKGVLENIAGFAAAVFGFSPREAEITDPQQRLFLECAWEALENAGYNPKTYPGKVGVRFPKPARFRKPSHRPGQVS